MLLIPVFDTLILPDVELHVQEDVFSEQELQNIREEEYFLIVPIKEQKERGALTEEDFYSYGIIGYAPEEENWKEEQKLLNVYSKERAKLEQIWIGENRMDATYEICPEIEDLTEEEKNTYLSDFKHYVTEVIKNLPTAVLFRSYIRRWKTINEAATNVGAYLDFDEEERAQILSIDSQKERSDMIMEGVKRLFAMKEVREELQEKMEGTENKNYKSVAIKRQIKLLEEQLHQMEDGEVSDEELFEKKIEEAHMPKEAEKEALRALKRFKMEGERSSEYGMLYDYLDFMTSLSWETKEHSFPDIHEAKAILEEDHHGLKKVKERVLEQIAVMQFQKKQKGSILLFVGAPGTGKTSMGQSIARALGREYVRISLGGVRDEAEIRGHRRTYVGAMPGRIMEGIKRSGVNDPVIVLDEIDKLGQDYKGDPASALLEVLDPEQNHSFVDHYLNVPYDLSNVFFLCTANSTDGIPKPLLDRMEVISLAGYTPIEKYEIGKKYLLPKAVEDAGLKKGNVRISAGAMRKIIAEYTREAGVRGLKKKLDKICRYAAVKLLEEDDDKIVITEKNLSEILGKKINSHEKAARKLQPGVATGLAWTQAGGEILFVETAKTSGSGKLHITGQLGDVMKESADLAYTLVKTKLQKEEEAMDKQDIHIHVPEGAVPKDGPSAGVTLYTALTSLLTGDSVRKDIAMTGEISLRGEVLPIGGLPEKLMAAERAGIKEVLIPAKNEKDLEEVPEEIKEKLKIFPVKTVEEVLHHAIKED